MVNCSEFMSGVEKARGFRNAQLTSLERCFYILCGLLILFGFTLVITGSTFIAHDLWNNGQFGFDKLKGMAAILICAYVIITWVFGCLGIAMTMNRATPVACVAVYGTMIFLFVAIPLMAEGSALHALGRLDEETFNETC